MDLFTTQPNALIHLTIALTVVALGVGLHISRMEWLIVLVLFAIVLMAEAFNTALEYLTDLVSPEYHPQAGKVKDAAAAGVLLAAMGAAGIGLWIFIPKIWSLLF